MPSAKIGLILDKLEALRSELADLAFDLECRGRLDAADMATLTAAHLKDLCAEFSAAAATPPPANRHRRHGLDRTARMISDVDSE
jgi:hypothetical protein